MSGDYILETSELTKEFKGFVAVNKVDLRVRRGTIHALIGPNGAGKTTCFNLLTKFLTPDVGHDRLRRRTTSRARSRRTIARRGVVRSFQISAVFPHLTRARERARRAAAQARHLVPLLEARSARCSRSTRARIELLRAVDLQAYARMPDGRAELRPQARARDRDHAGDGARS